MLVYANYLPIHSPSGLAVPIEPISEWLSRKLKRRLSADSLLRGGETDGKDGSHVISHTIVDQYPNLASFELVHPDSKVVGRRWHSEIGLRQREANSDVEVTVLIQTSEISTRVTTAVEPGAPTLVVDLLRRCRLSRTALSTDIRSLGDDDAEAFRYLVHDPGRDHPFVVASAARDGTYLADVAILAELLIGIAEVVTIPAAADTFWLARSVGPDFVPYLGAVKIIYPLRPLGRPTAWTLTQQDLVTASLNPRGAAKEIFSLVLHRTNVRMSWRHVRPTTVREELSRRELERRRVASIATGNAAEYARFLEDYVKEQEAITRQALAEKKQLEEALDSAQRSAEDAERNFRVKNNALALQLEYAGASSDDSPYAPEDIIAVAATVAASISGEPTPEECLKLLDHLFSTRISILPEAWISARDAGTFRNGRKLYGLLHRLATTYWSALSNGKPDQEARKVFGNAYAAKESEGVSTNKGAKRKRTFRFAGEDHLMVKHLKIGVKDSATETIRVHFEWFADRQRIVIGHCGAHIPFN